MTEYNFSSLSDYDFECLVRDLLQNELSLTLECFTTGSDRGIDLRYSKDTTKTLIVQCKHYINSGFNQLIRSLRTEIKKIEALGPERYILTTSVPLTPQRKEKILSILTPFCKTTSDILGQNDLNNLLKKYPDVEKNNFKLWLTSTAILERIFQSRIYNETNAEVDSIRRRLSIFVENKSFARAIEVLENQKYCIISGVPGIGKTTLAEMILIHYIDQGFEAIRIWESISEAREVFNHQKKQVFYYDDFLGRTGLDNKFQKNEDQRLLKFISDVRRSKNSRFILTTREYILNQAKLRYELLSESSFDLAKCIVSLSDYSQFVRARILYNHLYFSNLPKHYIGKILFDNSYIKIISHPNYNPRIIERMTDYLTVVNTPVDSYVKSFIQNLDNPERVWKFAFHNHLTIASRDLLIVMVSLPNIVSVDDLQKAYEKFFEFRSTKYHYSYSPYDFRNSIKELDGNFVKTQQSRSIIICEFYNPSIRDFLETHITNNLSDFHELLQSAVFPDQILSLWKLIKKINQSNVSDYVLEEFLTRLNIVFNESSARLIRYTERKSNIQYWDHWSVSKEELFMLGVDIVNQSKSHNAYQIFIEIKRKFQEVVLSNSFKSRELISVIKAIIQNKIKNESQKGEFFSQILEMILHRVEEGDAQLEDFEAVSTIVKDFPALIHDPQKVIIRKKFLEFSEYEIDAIIDNSEDASQMDNWFSELEFIASELGVALGRGIESAREDLMGRFDDYDEDRNYLVSNVSSRHDSSNIDEIHSMFQSILCKDDTN